MHPFVKLIATERQALNRSFESIAFESGVNRSTIAGWTSGRFPIGSVANVEAVLNALGYELVARKREDSQQSNNPAK
jgi:transcriptional regulator with XRE-family HTH domain